MACLLQSECNFLHSYFRCWLLVEVVDVEVEITSMQGMHIFRRDRTMQLIKCTPGAQDSNPTYYNQEDEDLSGSRRKDVSNTPACQ